MNFDTSTSIAAPRALLVRLLALCITMGAGGVLWASARPASAAQDSPATAGKAAPHHRDREQRGSAEQRRFTTQDAQAVTAAVNGYFRAFTEADWGHLDQYLTAPFVEMGPRPRYLASFADVLSTWHRIRDPLEGTDYAASKAVHVTVTALTPDSALADVYWQRVTKSGRVMDDGAEFYFASRQPDGSWRLNGHIGQRLTLYKGPR